MKRPILIDSLIYDLSWRQCGEEITPGKWAIAKNLEFPSLRQRLWHAWLIITGKARAFEFAIDRHEAIGTPIDPSIHQPCSR